MFRYNLLPISLFLSAAAYSVPATLYAIDEAALTVFAEKPLHMGAFEDLAPREFALKRVEFQSDCVMSKAEFEYLTDLRPGVIVNAALLYQAIQYLFAKQKFNSIKIKRHEDYLWIELHAMWTFEKVMVHGIWFGAEQYKQLYGLEFGESFDAEKHNHAVGQIKDFCKNNGYLSAEIKSTFNYNQRHKSVRVDVYIDLKNRFYIKEAKVEVQLDEAIHDDAAVIKKKIHKLLSPLRKKVYEKQKVEELLGRVKKFLEEEGYLHTTITVDRTVHKEEIDLEISVDIHMKRKFVFLGNSFFSHQALVSYMLAFGRSSWLLPAKILSEEIVRLYREHGFWRVTIEAQEESDRYFFVINEGVQASLSSIVFEKAYVFNHKLLKKQCFNSILSGGIDKKAVQQGCEHLVDWYLYHGYLDVKIEDLSYRLLDEETQRYELVLLLHEGPQYKITDCIIKSDHEELSKHLMDASDSYIGKQATPSHYERQRQALVHLYQQHGYLNPTLSLVLEKHENGSLIIKWDTQAGKKTLFGKTIVQDSARIPFGLLKRSDIKRGSLWNTQKIKSGFDQLKDLNVFDSLSITPGTYNGDCQQKPLMVKAECDEPFEVRLRGGMELEEIREYQTMHGFSYRFGGTFIAKNPFDAADLLRLDVELARLHREIVLKYQCPWVWYAPLRSIVQLYSIKHDQGFFRIRRDVYNIKQHGFLVGMYHNNGFIDAGCNLGAEWMETSINKAQGMSSAIMASIANAINFDVSLLDRSVPFAFIEPTLFINNIDNKLNPHKGSYTLCALKGMVPLKKDEIDSYFVRFLISHTMYVPIWSATGVIRLRVGHIFHKDFRAIMPNERFYLGGVNSLRSYYTDLAPPLGVFIDDHGKAQAVPQGGKSMVNANFELRVPIAGKFGATILQDFGFLSSNNFTDFESKKLLAGTGFGAWYATPVGMLRFDFAFKWSVIERFEESYAWFLTLSQSF